MIYSVVENISKYKVIPWWFYLKQKVDWITSWIASFSLFSHIPFNSNWQNCFWTVVNDWSWNIWWTAETENNNIIDFRKYDGSNYWLGTSRTIKFSWFIKI